MLCKRSRVCFGKAANEHFRCLICMFVFVRGIMTPHHLLIGCLSKEFNGYVWIFAGSRAKVMLDKLVTNRFLE